MHESSTHLQAAIAAGRALLAERRVVSLPSWALAANLPIDILTAALADPSTRAALERAIDARCVDAEGGCFLIR